MTAPWGKFFWADWESDSALKLCSLAAQGLWMRMLCIAASHVPIGYVAVAGRGLERTDLARMTGVSELEVADLLGELERNGVCSRDTKGRIYSRRMIRDAKRLAEAQKNGRKGGNPSLLKDREKCGGVNPPDKSTDNGGLKAQKPEARDTVSNDTGAAAPAEDPVKALFDAGVALLAGCGLGAGPARSMIGKWRKEMGDGWTLEAITAARTRGISQPVEWIEARKRSRPAAGGLDAALASADVSARRYAAADAARKH